MEVDSKTEKEINQLYSVNDSAYVIFSIHNQSFAYKSSRVQEIMYGAKVHPIPFTPDYVEGVLNCRGNPYTVVNTLKMQGEENCEIEEKIYLLFKRADDQLCIHISNIEVFFEPEEEDVYEDSVKYKLRVIPIFDAEIIEQTLCRDLGKED
ncbi:MAG: chemotaxis protein CheW [Treponema sp.]|nr:chemotaxis protein CheW [Treponema sp.]